MTALANTRRWRLCVIGPIILVVAACTAGAPSQEPTPTPLPAASSFAEYAVAFCSAFEAMFRAVGNPDTAAGSALSKALDQAVTDLDGTTAERLASEINRELESGRQHVSRAREWPPAAPAMAQLDRVFVAFEAMTVAKVAKARGEPGAVDPQAAFEGAGGVEAWFAMFEAYRAIGAAHPGGAPRCDNVPISP